MFVLATSMDSVPRGRARTKRRLRSTLCGVQLNVRNTEPRAAGVPGKKTPGGAGTHTGHTGHTGARGHTDHTDEPHNHSTRYRGVTQVPVQNLRVSVRLPPGVARVSCPRLRFMRRVGVCPVRV